MNPQVILQADIKHSIAQVWYSAHFDSHTYNKATAGKTARYGRALQDDAMALCGSPYFKISRRNWAKPALDFLARFEKGAL
jgi:hypothetical protein